MGPITARLFNAQGCCVREAGALAELMARLEALRQAIYAERLRRWDAEYPVGHGDREARKPICTPPPAPAEWPTLKLPPLSVDDDPNRDRLATLRALLTSGAAGSEGGLAGG